MPKHFTRSDPAKQQMVLSLVVDWFAKHRRDLPWRTDDATPWGVLVSEIMLQQTPVVRVLPVYEAWLTRWPSPADLAADPSGEAVRGWGRLGYPRRALRLHAAATACVERHDGKVPDALPQLKALPGVGDYTAAAVATFAFGQRHAVLDTNVRRVHARVMDGAEYECAGAPTVAERERALDLLPDDPALAATVSIAVMELGALVCTAQSPRCDDCPIAPHCAWLTAGRPEWEGPPRRRQAYAGTDRQCRGRLLGLLRDADGALPESSLVAVWSDDVQRERALASLVEDGLVRPLTDQGQGRRYSLPH
jgi:A/G-specific adenine glycosylase